MSERLKVAQVRAKDFKCIREVEITPAGGIVRISGAPGQGKTSILEAIEAGIAGGDKTLVRRGADRAEIFLSIGDLEISRKIPVRGRQTLRVKRDGLALTQGDGNALLKALFGPHIFRPIRWVQLAGDDSRGRKDRCRRQRDELLSAMPVRLMAEELMEAVEELGEDVLDAWREIRADVNYGDHGLMICRSLEAACYDTRKRCNAEVERAVRDLEQYQVTLGSPPEEDLEVLRGQTESAKRAYHMALGQVEARKTLRSRAEQLGRQIAREGADLPRRCVIDTQRAAVAERISTKEAEIEFLRGMLAKAETALDEARRQASEISDTERALDRLDGLRAELSELETSLDAGGEQDLEKMRKEIDEADRRVALRRAHEDHKQATHTVSMARARSERFDRLVKLFRDELPRRVVKRMNMPIDGLRIERDQVAIHGIPLHRLGTSEQIRVGVQVAIALNPAAGFVCVDGAESLGREGLDELRRITEELGIQLWMSEVAEEPAPDALVIRNGEISA